MVCGRGLGIWILNRYTSNLYVPLVLGTARDELSGGPMKHVDPCGRTEGCMYVSSAGHGIFKAWKVGTHCNLQNLRFQTLKQSRRPRGFLIKRSSNIQDYREKALPGRHQLCPLLSQAHLSSLRPTVTLKKKFFLKAMPQIAFCMKCLALGLSVKWHSIKTFSLLSSLASWAHEAFMSIEEEISMGEHLLIDWRAIKPQGISFS